MTADFECACGDRRSDHVLGRGNCRICRDGSPPMGGCQRFEQAFALDAAGNRIVSHA